jgi:hypothetical protein
MRALEIYGDSIREADAFVRELDESIRSAAFNFLMTVERTGLPIIGEIVPEPTIQQTNRALSPQELIHQCGVTSLMDKA